MKIGIIGLGSIGQRHVTCLKQIGYSDIIALRTKKGAIKELPSEFNYITQVYSSEEFYSLNPEGVIISNPTALHIEFMKTPLEKGIPIFLEKPIANSIEKVNDLRSNDVSKIMVGYCLRYHETINVIKSFLESNKLGKIYKANLYCGQFLPFWHTYADYKKEYYARKDLGGGVLRTLSHEIDLMHYLFGEVTELTASVDKISNLEIDVDDNVFMICKMKNESLITIELDYLNPISIRTGIIFGSRGILEYSFLNHTVILKDYNKKVETVYTNPNYDSIEPYINQMRDFVNLIQTKSKPRCNFSDGMYVMKVIEAAECSAESKTWQRIRGY